MRRVVFNQKGGVGKSTITCNLAAVSALRGQRTLVIDLDAQCNSSQYLLGDQFSNVTTSIADFFEATLARMGKPKLGDHVTRTAYENLDIIAAHPDLESLQPKLESRYKIYKLRDSLLKLMDSYDQVFIDTPPALNFYARSALIAAEKCLIPFDCDDFARQALYTLLDNISEIQGDHNDDLEVEGIVVNQFQARSKLPQRIVEELVSEGLPVLNTKLSSSVVIKESHDRSMPVVMMDPKHKLSLEFTALFDDLKG